MQMEFDDYELLNEIGAAVRAWFIVPGKKVSTAPSP